MRAGTGILGRAEGVVTVGDTEGLSILSRTAEGTGGGFRFLWPSQKDLVTNWRALVLSQGGGPCPEKASAQFICPGLPAPPRSGSAPRQYLVPLPL